MLITQPIDTLTLHDPVYRLLRTIVNCRNKVHLDHEVYLLRESEWLEKVRRLRKRVWTAAIIEELRSKNTTDLSQVIAIFENKLDADTLNNQRTNIESIDCLRHAKNVLSLIREELHVLSAAIRLVEGRSALETEIAYLRKYTVSGGLLNVYRHPTDRARNYARTVYAHMRKIVQSKLIGLLERGAICA